MGCITSKAIDIRSTSVREKSAKHALPWEQLLASASGRGDTLLSFVETKFRSTSFARRSTSGPEPDRADSKKFTPADIPAVGESSFERFTRSKSCQGPRREEEMLLLLQDSDPGGLSGGEIGWKDKSLTGSRSFHTVEEYDALLERIYRFGTGNVEHGSSWDEAKLQQPNSFAEDPNETTSVGNAAEDHPRETSGVKVGINLCCSNGSGSSNVAEADDGTGATGWKRRTVAKGLRSLDVSAVEFPAVARFKHRWNYVEGHVYSPGTYITPKFGSYNAEETPAGKEKEHGDNATLFSPELLAAFEDCMQQLQEDEDDILRDMDEETTQADNVMENQAEEALAKHV